MRREFAAAGNIAYNLKAIGGEPLIMATVGDDFGVYRARLESLNIPIAYPPCAAELYCPCVYYHRSGRQPDHCVPSIPAR